MRVLHYKNRKITPMIWPATTPQEELAAYLALFREFDGDYWQMYKASPPSGKRQRELYARAKAGDAEAARDLILIRKQKGYEYEDELGIVEMRGAS